MFASFRRLILLSTCLCAVTSGRVLAASVVLPESDDSRARPSQIQILDGEPKRLVVHGYSTSFRWPAILQRKLDRYFKGRRVIEVKSALKGGTPIARWIDLETGKPSPAWQMLLKPMLKGRGDEPVIVLAQQSLQWVFGNRRVGIRSADDEQRILQGAEALRVYSEQLAKDGADLTLIATHIYKVTMEPAIGNERLALSEFLESMPEKTASGPDVWEPTRELYPLAFAGDRVHPNRVGAEVMAQKWFECLLEHDGRAIPSWSVNEMNAVILDARNRQ